MTVHIVLTGVVRLHRREESLTGLCSRRNVGFNWVQAL